MSTAQLVVSALPVVVSLVIGLLSAWLTLSGRWRRLYRRAAAQVDAVEAWVWDARRDARRHNAEHHPDGVGELLLDALPATMVDPPDEDAPMIQLPGGTK